MVITLPGITTRRVDLIFSALLLFLKMVWSDSQIIRLGIEKETLDKYFPNRITWIDPMAQMGSTQVEVTLTSNSDSEYVLRVYLSPDFPNSCPKLVILFPKDIFLQDGRPIPELSSAFHTLKKKDGFQSICHFYPPDWKDDNTIYQVFMKGRLWIEAYEGHLETGRRMDVFLGEQQFTPDPTKPWLDNSEWDDSSDIYEDEEVFSSDYDDDRAAFRQTPLEPRAVESQQGRPLSYSNNPRGDPERTICPPTYQAVPRFSHNTSTSSLPESSSTPTSLPIPPPLSAPRATNRSSTPRRFVPPPGAIDIFSAFRGRSQSESPRQLRPPSVQPKPKRPPS